MNLRRSGEGTGTGAGAWTEIGVWKSKQNKINIKVMNQGEPCNECMIYRHRFNNR